MPAYFSTIKNGYNPDEVDRHINNLESVISSYKEKDAAISNAIVNAQIAADNIIKNAELAAADIRRNAYLQLEKIEGSVGKQRDLVQNFQDDYKVLANKYLRSIDENEFKEVTDRIDALDKYIGSLRDIGSASKANTAEAPNEASEN